jgi:predicted nucleic-acid-binding protein
MKISYHKKNQFYTEYNMVSYKDVGISALRQRNNTKTHIQDCLIVTI